jgi:predicted PhzF superfamily epimerase YddE/YHI9
MSAARAAVKRYTIHVVDVFTERPLAGNQLASSSTPKGFPAK